MNVVLSATSLCSDDVTLTMLVDRGAAHDFVDPLLTPWLQESMTDYSVLSVPHTIVTAGQHVLQGVATDTVRVTISDDGSLERVVSFHAVVVPGMGANLFSVTEAMRKGVATIFIRKNPGWRSTTSFSQ